METIEIIDAGQLDAFIANSPLAAVYFSGPDCAVCEALKPKLMALLAERFPALAVATVDCGRHGALAAQQRVFSIPTLVLFMDGREAGRYVRAFSPAAVAADLERPYSILHGGD